MRSKSFVLFVLSVFNRFRELVQGSRFKVHAVSVILRASKDLWTGTVLIFTNYDLLITIYWVIWRFSNRVEYSELVSWYLKWVGELASWWVSWKVWTLNLEPWTLNLEPWTWNFDWRNASSTIVYTPKRSVTPTLLHSYFLHSYTSERSTSVPLYLQCGGFLERVCNAHHCILITSQILIKHEFHESHECVVNHSCYSYYLCSTELGSWYLKWVGELVI